MRPSINSIQECIKIDMELGAQYFQTNFWVRKPMVTSKML